MRLLFSLLLLLGCSVQAEVATRPFTDDLGRVVNVPLHPQRIVSLHDLDITIPLIELGVPPVASHGRTRPDGSHFLRSGALLTGVDFDHSTIKFIGTADIDIEAIVAAKPDLIITEPSRHTPIEQLEKIAPTVSIDHLDGGAPEIYRKLAQPTHYGVSHSGKPGKNQCVAHLSFVRTRPARCRVFLPETDRQHSAWRAD